MLRDRTILVLGIGLGVILPLIAGVVVLSAAFR